MGQCVTFLRSRCTLLLVWKIHTTTLEPYNLDVYLCLRAQRYLDLIASV